MRRHRKKDRLKRKEKRLKYRIKLRTIFLLSTTLIFNTYAWFLYVTTVSSNLTAHVDAWRVEFEIDDQTVEREFSIQLDNAYPGMPNRVKTRGILNSGERAADIGYVIKYFRVFNTRFYATDQLGANETAPQGATGMTAAALLSKIQNDYPFSLDFDVDDATVDPGDSTTLDVTFSWPFDSGDDETDTDYGTQAYTYYTQNNNTAPIEIGLKLIVTQHQNQS